MLVGRFQATSPVRLLDTRNGSPIGANSATDVVIAGQGGVPMSGVVAVALNVTVEKSSGDGSITLGPKGKSKPETTTAALVSGKGAIGFAAPALGLRGAVTVYNSTAAAQHVTVDLVGWWSASSGSGLKPIAPVQIVDTRTGGVVKTACIPKSGNHDVVVGGFYGIPRDARAVILHISSSDAPVGGYQGGFISTTTIAQVRDDGGITVPTPPGTNTMLVHVIGYFHDSIGGGFRPVANLRAYDSRRVAEPVGDKETFDIPLRWAKDVAGEAKTVVATFGVFDASSRSTLTTWASGTARPDTHVMHVPPNAPSASMVLAPVDDYGWGSVRNESGKVSLTIDVLGYFVS